MEILLDEKYGEQLAKEAANPDAISSWNQFKLTYQAAKSSSVPDFEGLVALSHLPHIDFLPHQKEAAEEIIHQMQGRAILADEVGLGKTIEAGLVLKEYLIRGMVNKVLILTPASLVNQWVTELHEKFHIQAYAPRKNPAWKDADIMVTSIDMAKRDPHYSEILSIPYDLIIIDEAHKLKNPATKNYQFVKALQKKYCLLLTATPIQNRITDIFNLVSILKPGYLGDLSSFKKEYGKKMGNLDGNVHLKKLISKVMIRNRRQDTGLADTKRMVKTEWIEFSEEEQQVYEKLETIKGTHPSFTYLTLAKELCSSREACYLSSKQMYDKLGDPENTGPLHDLISGVEQLPHHAKAKRMVEIIEQSDEKFIVFTEYRASQYYLQWYLQQHGISSVPFRGGFKRSKKDWMKQLFRDHAQVMIATEAAGEGINLQFCRNMINYDLPWNPMRLEQRIGRIHRFGQEKNVQIYNFAIKNTIEEHILNLLYDKISLFENAIGELDHILEDLDIKDLGHEIEAIYSESSSYGEAKIKLNNLASVISSHSETERRSSS
ncbi:helicase [Thalassobacillus devorans]|uniref:Helicase n=1 Tax=Thalassobacillus devorans TaxID=279813 RepID=A0ABQ1P5P8_9BACI|nr:SNF2-related protein [Thalassobacillus devorans]NIK29621.1 SNF2 family DNA or RNA helicase [Thalassobacillus devorans]GGC91529.1 helicase [Thalassobacillus devorans]